MTVVEIMVSFTKSGIDLGIIVSINYHERSAPHSTALIFLNSKTYILFEKNHPSSSYHSLKFKKILFLISIFNPLENFPSKLIFFELLNFISNKRVILRKPFVRLSFEQRHMGSI